MATQLKRPMPGKSALVAKIKNVQAKWAAGVVAIGRAESYKEEANKMLDELYDFDKEGDFILFKPTLASKEPVRVTRKETASYFIGGSIQEDGNGFARTPWETVSFDKDFFFTVLDSGDILVMGRCTFKTKSASERPSRRKAVADYTFGYRNESMRIFLHHSSLKVAKKEQSKCQKEQYV